ncbi:pyridoxal phosphate-dependent aminotransferase [Pelagovum sp. HNIBRBA483]|uniref:pyridoxal phosphate-dependent aminotransferase n=1 Tax=Pelagovum sp. HNIBRBA483 TaxID=3233341 RepID=UPI0034A56261
MTQNDPRLTPLIAALPSTMPFNCPDDVERALERPFAARIGANECGFGPSPKALEAISKAAPEIWKYGDGDCHDLRMALADHHQIGPEHIMIGEGIDGLLGQLVRLTVTEGTPVVTSRGSYPTFNYHVKGYGGVLHEVPYTGDHEDPERLIAKARSTGARLIYISNPNNPMGNWHDADVIARMISEVPEGALLILDEAYCDFAPASATLPIVPDDPRVIRMRTFSKAYGLAGQRVGYAIGAVPIISAFDRIRNQFGVNMLGQVAALAALHDRDWYTNILQWTSEARARIGSIAEANGLRPLTSATNFVTIDCGADGELSKRIVAELGKDAIFIRMPFQPPQNRCIRVSTGNAEALDAFEAALPAALERARKS